MSKSEIDRGISRRSFVKWASVVTGSAALAGGLTACSPASMNGTEAKSGDKYSEVGEWKTALCPLQFAGCGGSCIFKALVNDGQVVRLKTDASGEDTPANPQMRGCVRGRQYEHIVYAADRLKYPMKRKNWAPGGGANVNGHLRGIDEWERLSWDEATTLIAEETKRIVDAYGSKSILLASDTPNYLTLLGGGVTTVGASSWGGWWWTLKLSVGGPGVSGTSTVINDKLNLRKSKLIVMWGANPAWSSQAQSTYSFRAAKEAGAKFIFVDPIYHDTAKVLGNQFIGVRPGTDAAMLLAMAYVIITNNLQDQEFLDRYTVGFDAGHVPEGTDPNENYKDYVLGTFDNMPKTPEWASEICGCPPDIIESFAKEVATTKPMAFLCQRAPARTSHGEQFAQNFLTVGWMTGNVGKDGACVGHGFGGNKDIQGSGPALVKPGGAKKASYDNPTSPYEVQNYNPFDPGDWTAVHANKMWDAVLDGKYQAGAKGMQPIDIHMINCNGRGNDINQNGGAAHGIEAFRKVDFVVAADFFLTTKCLYADIVLPIATKWETPGISATAGRRREVLVAHEQVIEPLFEVKTDQWIDVEVGKKLGFTEGEILGVSEQQQGFNTVAGATVIDEAGEEFTPLITITQADLGKC